MVNREQEILSTTRRKVAQGYTVEQQYADLNTAREKRRQRNAKRLQQVVSGAWKQIPILKP
jgi:hypothetical protein